MSKHRTPPKHVREVAQRASQTGMVRPGDAGIMQGWAEHVEREDAADAAAGGAESTDDEPNT